MTTKNTTSTMLFSIPKAVTMTHHAEAKACMATWVALSSPHFRDAVTRGLSECGRLGAKSWIVNLTGKDPGVPKQADFAWVSSDGLDIAKRNGVRAVINVLGASKVAAMGAKRFSKIVTEGGISTYECTTVADALQLAADVAAGRAA